VYVPADGHCSGLGHVSNIDLCNVKTCGDLRIFRKLSHNLHRG
jgi:hypothetical protein